VVNHNGADHLAATLDAILCQEPAPAEVLLVDSGSDDGSLSLVAERYPSVHVIAMGENVGPAAARNAGIDRARYDRILFVDDDVAPAPTCAERLLDALEHVPAAAAAMPRVGHAHDRERIQYAGADAHFTGTMMLHACNTLADSEDRPPRRIGSLVSACFVFDRSRRPGLRFDERFFIYFEDHDFALRARIAGSEILAVESAWCYHGLGTAGLSLRRTGRYARLRVLCVIRNRWQVLLKCYEFRTLVLLAPVLVLYELLQVAIVAKRGWWGEWFEALRSTLRHARAVARDRHAVQAGRMVPDRALLRGGPLPFADALTTSRIERTALRIVDGVMSAYWRMISPVL
jgi:GT2 family glycosyltransferase